jgi:TonB-linked SusC/RagA family outer membrane protein
MKKVLLMLLLFVGTASMAIAQRTITGTVTDDAGEGLIGATVLVQGTSVGTTTDIDGSYRVVVPAGYDMLQYSYTGYATKTMQLGASNIMDVVLKVDDLILQEVVVTGTGIATDRRRTAIAVETVSADQLNPVSSGNIDLALQGKIPGAQIQSISGQPGQQANIILRGINSLGSTNPMILIDGVQISTDNVSNGSARNLSSRLADIDFSNVERVEIVQGAAAATIYGAQGANGVIQIFTKRGKKGAPRITLNNVYGFSNPILGSYMPADRHAFQMDEQGRILSGADQPLERNAFGVWGSPLFRTGNDVVTDGIFNVPISNLVDDVFQSNVVNARTSVNVSGGSDNMDYSFTGTYNHQESSIIGRNNRINLNSNIGVELAKGLTARFGLAFIQGDNTTGTITGTNSVFSPLGAAVTSYPYLGFTERVNGNFVANPGGDNSVNPLYTFENRLMDIALNRVIPNFNLNYQPFDFLMLDYKLGYDYYRDDFTQYIPNQQSILAGSNQAGITPIVGQIQIDQRIGALLNQLVSSTWTFGSDNGLLSNTLVNFDYRKNTFQRVTARGTGLPFYTPVTLRAASDQFVDEYYEEFVTYGFLVNEKLEYKGRVGVSGGIRVDWSSAFGQGSDPFIFPRADVYARLSEFDFWGGLKDVLPEVKVRAAYGQAGIQPGAFDRIVTLSAGQIGSGGYLAPQILLRNPNLGVQISKETEFGLDFGLNAFRGKSFLPYVGVNFTVWSRVSEDIIRNIGVAPSTGASEIVDNAITLNSNGIQLGLRKEMYNSRNFKWQWTTNFSTQTTILESISNNVDIPVDQNFLLAPGVELGTFRGRKVLTAIDELDSDGELIIPADQHGNFTIAPESGYVVNKVTRAPVLTNEVLDIGNGMPDFIMSFIHDFTINRSLRLSFQLDWFQGFQIYNQTKQWAFRDNNHIDVTQPITVDGESGAFLNYYRGLYATNLSNSHFVEDGSFLRLRNVSVSYDLATLFKSKSIRSLELSVTGFNLLTFTKYTGFDPEAASDLNDPTRIGLDQYAFPNARGIQFGLNLGF